MKNKIIRITTVPQSLDSLLKGQLNFMSEYFKILAISSSGNGFLQKFGKNQNIRTLPVEMTRKITPILDLIAAWNLFVIFKKEKPFIVHSHTPKAGSLSMLAAYFAGVPHRLHTIAGLPLLERTGFQRYLLDTIERITYRFATKIYPNSVGLAKIIIENQYCKKDKIKVIGNGSSNGIDLDYFNPNLFQESDKLVLKNKLNISKEDFVFIFIGRLVKDKGINELMEAFDKFSVHHENVTLLLVGYLENDLDPISERSKYLIENHKKVCYAGAHRDVRPYLAISDAFVFPSYREGFPNVVMEAGAMGLKSIVSDINGCNEIIENEVNGLIIPPKNAIALYEAMRTILLSTQIRFLDSENIRLRIKSKYDRLVQWEYILKEYKSLEISSS